MTRKLRLTVVLAIGIALLITAAPALAGYRVARTVGKLGGAENEYNDPGSLTLDGHDHLFVADTLNNRIVKTDATDGDYQNDWFRSGDLVYTTLSGPHTVSADEHGDIWVVDQSKLVQVFDTNGVWLGELTLHSPGVVVSATADLHGHVFVGRYDNIDPDNALIVPGFRGFGETYTRSGQFLNTIGVGPQATDGGVAFGPNGHMYALDRIANTVVDVDLKGGTLTATWTRPQGGSAFNEPTAIDVDRYGFVYVAEGRGQRVDKMTPDGVLVATLKAKRGPRGPFTPGGVAVADGGGAWVSDSENDRLVLFTPTTPETIVDTPPRGLETNTRTPSIRVSSDVKGARFHCTVDGGKPTVCAQSDGVIHLHFPTEGFHVLTVRAIDKLGVRDPTPARVAIDVDLRKPVITSTFSELTTGGQILVNAAYPDGAAPIDLSWHGRDDRTRGRTLQFELLAQYGRAQPFAPFSTTEQFGPSTRRDTVLGPGLRTAFRVEARDLAGNIGHADFTPHLALFYQDSDAGVTYTGTTQSADVATYPGAWGGTARTLEPGATATLKLFGHAVAVVMRKQDGPARRVKICLANGQCTTVNVGGDAADRQIVFARNLKRGTHTITVTAIDEVTLDGFVALAGG